MRDKLEKDTERESQLKAALRQEEEQRRKEEEQRNLYVSQKKEQEAAKAKINQEIMSGMERLRLEKEKESKPAPPPASPAPEKGPLITEAASAAPALTPQELDDPFI